MLPVVILLVQASAGSGATQTSSLQGGVQSGLSLTVYNNTGLAGAPASARLIPDLSFTLPLSTAALSAEAVGTLRAEAGLVYNFSCDFGDATYAALHVDDHLVCQHGVHLRGVPPGGECQRQAGRW